MNGLDTQFADVLDYWGDEEEIVESREDLPWSWYVEDLLHEALAR